MTTHHAEDPSCFCDSPVSHPAVDDPPPNPDWPDLRYMADGSTYLDTEETSFVEARSFPFEPVDDTDRDLNRSFRHSGWSDERDCIARALQASGFPEARLNRFHSCGSTAFVLTSGGENPRYRIASNRCHDRFCVPCANEKRRVIAANLVKNLPDAPLRLLTFTQKATDESLSNRLDRLYADFRKIRARLHRRLMLTGGIAFLEITRNEVTGQWHPHLHCICQGKYIPQQWLRDQWLEVTGDSYIVDIRLIRGREQAASYVLKYASKTISPKVWRHHEALCEAIRCLSGKRTFNTFGDWTGFALSRVPESGEVWEFLDTLSNLIRRYKAGDSEAGAILSSLANRKYDDPAPLDFPDTT